MLTSTLVATIDCGIDGFLLKVYHFISVIELKRLLMHQQGISLHGGNSASQTSEVGKIASCEHFRNKLDLRKT